VTLLATILVIVGVVWLLRPLFSGSPGQPPPEIVPAAAPPPPPTRDSVSDTLRSGETLAELMADQGFDPLATHRIVEVIRDYKRPRTLRPGVALRFSAFPGEAIDRIELQMNADTLLHLAEIDSVWTARLEVVPVVVDTLRLAGLIESSLWFAELSGDVDRLSKGEFEEFVFNLADVFAWKVDFTRDIWKGDAFRVLMEREVRPDGSIRARRFLAIELRNREQTMSAIPFTRDGRREYFDRDGEALRGVFLRYPVPYRITSGFTNRRYHPVLKRNRPHRGIDYGAPYGTRVQATAAGTVTKAQRSPSYGKYVEIRHTGGIRTRYAHLSSIAVPRGAKFEQGQVIGRVGATGLARGSHLHYEFIQNGRHRNPFNVQLPSVPALEDEHMAEFEHVRDRALERLAALPMPSPTGPVAAVRE